MEEQPGIDVPVALARLGGNRTLLMRLLAEFAKTQGDAAAVIRAAIDQGKVEDAARHAHTLKGVAGNLSANRLAAAATAVEATIRTGGTSAVVPLLAGLDQAMAEVLSGLATPPAPAIPPAATAAAAAAVPGADLARMMVELDALLERNSLAARRSLAPLKQTLDERGADTMPLASAIDRLSFVEARHALRALAAPLAIALPPI